MRRQFAKDVKKMHIINRPMSLSDITFDDLYEEISDHWEEKARRLQQRRWRQLSRRLA